MPHPKTAIQASALFSQLCNGSLHGDFPIAQKATSAQIRSTFERMCVEKYSVEKYALNEMLNKPLPYAILVSSVFYRLY